MHEENSKDCFFYKPKEQAVCVDVQPNHSEIGTSLTCSIIYTEKEFDFRMFHCGGILKVWKEIIFQREFGIIVYYKRKTCRNMFHAKAGWNGRWVQCLKLEIWIPSKIAVNFEANLSYTPEETSYFSSSLDFKIWYILFQILMINRQSGKICTDSPCINLFRIYLFRFNNDKF